MSEVSEGLHADSSKRLLRNGERLENCARFMAKFRTKEGWASARASPADEDEDEQRGDWDEELMIATAADEDDEAGVGPMADFFFTTKMLQKYEHVLYEQDVDRFHMTMMHKIVDWGERERPPRALRQTPGSTWTGASSSAEANTWVVAQLAVHSETSEDGKPTVIGQTEFGLVLDSFSGSPVDGLPLRIMHSIWQRLGIRVENQLIIVLESDGSIEHGKDVRLLDSDGIRKVGDDGPDPELKALTQKKIEDDCNGRHLRIPALGGKRCPVLRLLVLEDNHPREARKTTVLREGSKGQSQHAMWNSKLGPHMGMLELLVALRPGCSFLAGRVPLLHTEALSVAVAGAETVRGKFPYQLLTNRRAAPKAVLESIELCFNRDWMPFLTESGFDSHDEIAVHVPNHIETFTLGGHQNSLLSEAVARWGQTPDSMFDAQFLWGIFNMGSRGRGLFKQIMKNLTLRPLTSTTSPDFEHDLDLLPGDSDCMWVRGDQRPYPYVEDLDEDKAEEEQGEQDEPIAMLPGEQRRRRTTSFSADLEMATMVGRTQLDSSPQTKAIDHIVAASREVEEGGIDKFRNGYTKHGAGSGKASSNDKKAVYFWDRQIADKLGTAGLEKRSARAMPLQGSLAPVRNICTCWEELDFKTGKPEIHSLLRSLVDLDDPKVFDCILPQVVVQFKWDQYGRDGKLGDFWKYMVMTVLFSLHVLFSKPSMYTSPWPYYYSQLTKADAPDTNCIATPGLKMLSCRAASLWAWIFWALGLIFVVAYIKDEVNTGIRMTWSAYTRSNVNKADMLNMLLLSLALAVPMVKMLIAMPGLADGSLAVNDATLAKEPITDLLRAMAVLVCWMCSLARLMLPFSWMDLPKLVRLMSSILIDPKFLGFCLILLVLIFGFEFAFLTILRNADPLTNPDSGDHNVGWSNFGIGFISTFNAMLGDVDVTMLSTGFDHASYLTPVMRFLYFVFMFIMNIVLFNAVIAIMGDRYENAMENEEQHPGVNLLSRAKYLLECEKVMPKEVLVADTAVNPGSAGAAGAGCCGDVGASEKQTKSRENNFPVYLHVLMAAPLKDDAAEVDDDALAPWAGRVDATRKLVQNWAQCCLNTHTGRARGARGGSRLSKKRGPSIFVIVTSVLFFLLNNNNRDEAPPDRDFVFKVMRPPSRSLSRVHDPMLS